MRPTETYISMYATEVQIRSINEAIHLLTKNCSHTDNIEAIRKLCDALENLKKITNLDHQED